MIKTAKTLQQEAQKPSSMSMPMREKYWDELNPKEKIERMRNIIHRLQKQLENANQTIRLLERHSHNKEGETVVVSRLSNRGNGEEITQGYLGQRKPMNPDEVYF